MNIRSFLRINLAVVAMVINQVVAQPLDKLKLLDTYIIPFDQRFDNTQVGGLSGIDYDPGSDSYYFICDDRSALQPARFYQARINLSAGGIDTVVFMRKVDLIGPDGKTYPSFRKYPNHTIDPEAMRRNPATGELIWLSEGERILKAGDTVLVDPAIVITQDGLYTGEFPLPANAHMSKSAAGPRQNGSFEAMCFTDNGQAMWVALEEPLFEDGPRADVEDSPSLVRFYKFDVATRKNTAQFAYDLDPVAHAPILGSAFRVNGITDILDAGSGQFLVLERSFSTGRLPCTVKIFLAGFQAAGDVKGIRSLKETRVSLATKKLLLNMDELGVHVDNVEGITWGPVLPNGNRTLLLVTDNNFQEFQKTQIFLFEVSSR